MKKLETFYQESRVRSGTRMLIVRAAVSFILENSVAELSIQSLTKAAGLTARNIYRYYENRNFLLMDALYYIISSCSVEQPVVIAEDTSGRDQLKTVIDYYFLRDSMLEAPMPEFGMTQGDFLRILFELDYFLYNLPDDDRALERYRQLYTVHMNPNMKNQLRDALQTGARDHTLHLCEDEVPFYIEYIIQAMRGIGTLVVLKQNERSSINRALVLKTADMILHYLSAPAGDP